MPLDILSLSLVWPCNVLGPLQLNFESLHPNLETIHSLRNTCLTTLTIIWLNHVSKSFTTITIIITIIITITWMAAWALLWLLKLTKPKHLLWFVALSMNTWWSSGLWSWWSWWWCHWRRPWSWWHFQMVRTSASAQHHQTPVNIKIRIKCQKMLSVEWIKTCGRW